MAGAVGETSPANSQVDFDLCHALASAWLSANVSSEWHLLWADSEERQLVFEHETTGVNFSISVLDKAHRSRQECFKVRSDTEPTWSLLRDCKGNTIEECLAQSIAALKPLVKDTEMSDDEHDEDGDMNDYYISDEDIMETESSTWSNPTPHSALQLPSSAQRDPPETADMESDSEMYAKSGSSMAVHRLLSDLKMFKKSSGTSGIEGSPRGDNLFIWDVKLTDFERDSVLGRDLATYAARYNQPPEVQLEMTFPQDYPISPPFIRIIRPRFKFLTGHVTIGGSICMELLTKSGWRPINDIESILVQVRAAILSDPKAGLEMTSANREYTAGEARRAFDRMTQRYGWNK